ncbi:MAG: autotransporter domain-containing protein, partial [Phascolarctobacterium sp.]|nr:autotransporter domain-containing protein [Candidatus Phascolarctobacterium caballi]
IIGGAGDIYIDGDVSSDAGYLQGDKMTVSDSSTLTLTNGELDKAVTNNGTVKLDGATLNGAYVTDGTLEFAQNLEISADYVAADANVVDDGATLTLIDGNLAEEVTGAGGITFNGDVSANADKIKTTGTNTVESEKTLTLTDGTLGSEITNAGTIKLDGATLGGEYVTDGTLEFAADLSINADYIAAATNQVDDGVTLTCSTGSLTSNITNSGTVNMASGSSFGDRGKITGGAVTLGDGVEFTESNFDNITSLALDNAVYNLSATVVDGGVNVSQLPSCATGTITLGDITIDGANYDSWEEGDYKQIQFADLSTDNLTVSGSQEAILSGYVYTFSQAYTIAGDSSSGIKYGYFDVVKEIAETRTLKEVIAQDDGDIKYSLRADENVDGTIELRDSSAGDPRTLTIKNSGGNTYEIIAENSDAVLKNNNSDTLTLEKVTVSGFDTAIENATADGTVNLKSVTFENTGTIDVVNDGTLNILDGNVVFDKGVTGTGTMNVKDNLTVGANTTIEQNIINIDTGKTLTNNGTITINDGSLNGDGTTPLTNAGTVVINNGNLNTIVDGGVLEFDGTSSVEKAEYIAGDTNRIRSNASLKLANETEGELKAILDGDGEVIIDSAIDATNGGINTKVTINADKSLKINADNLGNEATNNGTLTLIGGTGDDGAVLNNAVSGSGTTVISGGASGNELTVTAKDAITTSGGITVEQYNTLQISASNIGADVTNNGTIKLAGDLGDTGETLSYSINGGAVEIASGTYDFTDITNLNTANTITLKDGTVTMDAEDLFTSDYAGKTDFGGKFTAEGGTLCLNNFDNKETFTTEEFQKATDLIGNPNVVVMIDAELATGEGEDLVIKGTDDGSGNVTLSGVPVVADTSGGGGSDINVPAVPKNYVPVTDDTAVNLLSADTITVDGGKFVTKGLQIDNLNSGSTLDLVIQGTGTDVTFTGGDGETGVVKKNTDEKVKVDLAVKNGAVFNAGINAGTDRGEFTFESVTIEHAKMNICRSTVETPVLTIGDGGWLVVDPGYFKADTMNIMGGAIQVIADGSVYNQGYAEDELRAIVEDAGIGTTKIPTGGFIATSDIGIMAVRTNKGGNNVTLDKSAGTYGDHLAITSDPSYTPNNASTPMLRIDDNALLILDGSRLMSNTGNGVIHLLNSTADDVVISNKARVYVAGVSKKGVGIYKMITGPGVDKDADYFGNNFKTDNTLYKVVLLEPDERIENTFAFKIMWNEENTVFSSENLGVSRGAYDVATAVTGAIAEHFYDKELGEKLWATYVHDKDKIDGLKVGGVGAKYDFQFNGTLIGYDFLTEKDTTAGVAFGYINGNTNGFGHNDSKYYDLTAYGRKTVDGINLLGNISYLHGKNETSMVLDGEDVNANAKTNTYTIGVTADKPYAWGNGNISPFAGLHYLRIGGKDYTNGVGMKFKADTINTFVLPLGVKYDMEVNNFYGWKVKPTIMAGYMWNLGDKDSTLHVKNDRLTSSYGYDLTDKRAFFTKAGLQFVKKNVSVGVGYDYMKSSRSHNNRWSVNLSWSF